MKVRRPIAALAIAVSIAAILATSAAAAPTPGTPLAVAPGVPDQGRAWELVTQADPTNAQVYGMSGVAEDGNRISYYSSGPLPDSPSAVPALGAALAVRGADGWTDSMIPVPHPELVTKPFGPWPLLFSPNLTAVIQPNEVIDPESGEALYRGVPGDGNYEFLAEVGPEGWLVGASADLQHVVFTSKKHLLPADAGRTSGQSVYEVAGSALRLVDVDDQGELVSACGSTAPYGEYAPRSGNDSVSRDGDRIFFTSQPCAGSSRVFLREDGATTTDISASQCDLADCGPEESVEFAGATPDGSVAFLLTAQRLTDADTNSHADLYRYDVGSGELTLLPDVWEGGTVTPIFRGEDEALLCSGDGSRVYFEAELPEGGGRGIFLADAGGLHRLPGSTEFGGIFGGLTDSMELTPDGRYALYTSTAELVPGDTDESTDVYRYDADSHSVTLTSTGPSGGNGAFDARFGITGFVNAGWVETPLFHAMSSDGSRVFFSTAERLVPADHNDVRDVYEWANGSVGLVSAGAGKIESSFLGASRDGGTVFFETVDTLVPRDRDGGEVDFYAARIGGGFDEAAPPAGCQSSCSATPQSRLDRTGPASAEARGGGIRVAPIGAAARRRIVATGWIEILAEIPKSGRLSAAAKARIGGRERTIAATTADAEAGPARLRMRLSKEARRALTHGEGLRVSLRLRLSGLGGARKLSLRLGAER